MNMNNGCIRMGPKKGGRFAWARDVTISDPASGRAVTLVVCMKEQSVGGGTGPAIAREVTVKHAGKVVVSGDAPIDGAPLRAALVACGLFKAVDDTPGAPPATSWAAPTWCVSLME